VDVAAADVVVLLTRAPSAGGKTRLFAALERPPDAALLRALLLDTLDGVRASGAHPLLAVTPASACDEVCRLAGADAFAQSDRDDLGERMRAAMAQAFALGARRVVLIGSDLPGIRASHLREAFAILDRDPEGLVLGPALDGGYYLLGASAVPPVFAGVPWGTRDVLAATRTAAARAAWRVHLLAPLGDVDTIADLQRLTPDSPRSFSWARANGIVSSRGSATDEGSS
jgi:rSAM/selenodomain-associated transferase 1